jgi:hypothetical protein
MVLELDVATPGRSYVETETGIRLVDLHTGPGAPIRLHLPVDLGGLFVEQVDGAGPAATREFRLPAQNGHVLLSALTPSPAQVRARGAGHEAFMHLFARPFDLAAVNAFALESGDEAQLRWNQEVQDAKARQTYRRKLALGAWGVSVGAAAVGAGMFWSAHNIHNTAMPHQPEWDAANDSIRLRNTAGVISLGVAGASAVTGALLYFWPSAPHLSVSSTPGCEACLAFQRSF